MPATVSQPCGEIDTVFQEITTDQDLSRIQILYEPYDLGYINTWEKQGAMGIPMYLAAALVGKLDLDWGEEYESSKDAMHFELIGDRKHWAPHIEPDDKRAKGEKHRTLKRLIESAFQSKIPKLRLDATLKL